MPDNKRAIEIKQANKKSANIQKFAAFNQGNKKIILQISTVSHLNTTLQIIDADPCQANT